ncbi:MAG: DUF3466 family protein [Armatimonadetes bacterium]|nr:DUF3466 family protein [Armatimonadota bacterium]
MKNTAFMAGLFVTALCVTAEALPMYSATALHPAGHDSSTAYSINNAGGVVGDALSPSWSAFRWNTDQGMSILPVPDGYFAQDSHALAVNDSGVVAGYCGKQDGPRAVVWNENGMVDLGLGNSSFAYGINNAGEVVGRTGHFGFVWRPGLGVTTLAYGTTVRGINNAGMMAGEWDDIGVNRAVVWNSDAEMTDIGGLPGSHENAARAINNAGQVVGWSTFPSGPDPWLRGFVWTESGGFTEIPALSGALRVTAYDINDVGVVVGSLEYPTRHNAFIYTPDSGTVDLNILLDSASQDWTLYDAYGINNLGQIVGYGLDKTGLQHAFLLTPVPEPSPVVALLCGIVTTAGLGLRRKTRR